MAETKKEIKVLIRRETFWESLRNDITSILLLAGLVALNEATLASSVLNFLFGLLGLIMMLGMVHVRSLQNMITGTDKDEILRKTKEYLDKQEL